MGDPVCACKEFFEMPLDGRDPTQRLRISVIHAIPYSPYILPALKTTAATIPRIWVCFECMLLTWRTHVVGRQCGLVPSGYIYASMKKESLAYRLD